MAISAEALARQIVTVLADAGHVAYFAGGCVRDRLMGRTPSDYDVATSARPERVLTLFPRSQKVGVAFGVVIVRRGDTQVEVATFRSESTYSDGRRPDAVTFTTPEIDARRRDFTCNGIFFDPRTNTIHDFVDGQADIRAGVLRAIGDPAQRFAEDHLRMLRAVRFAAKLGFQIDEVTRAAIHQHAQKIQGISRERIGEEMRLIFEHPSRARAAELLAETGLLHAIWPAELRSSEIAYPHVAAALEPVDRAMGLAALQLDLRPAEAAPAAEALRGAFMLSNEDTADVAWFLEHAVDARDFHGLRVARQKRLLADPRWQRLWRIIRSCTEMTAQIETQIARLEAQGVAPPPLVTGDTLIALGAKPGPLFKRWLDELYDRQLEGGFASTAEAEAAARKLIHQTH